MLVLKNIQTGFIFDIEDSAGVELLRTNKLLFEIVEATKEALEKVTVSTMPTDEQRLLGTFVDIDKEFKNVKIIEEKEKINTNTKDVKIKEKKIKKGIKKNG